MTSLALSPHQPLGVPLAGLRRMSGRRLAGTIMAVLAVGITLSILTTTDGDWWRMYFSALGTTGDLSAVIFNGTLIAAGGLIAVFASRVARDLKALRGPASLPGHRVLPAFVVSVGFHLAGIGAIPLNVNTILHNLAGLGIVISFLGMLTLVIVRRRHLPAMLTLATLAIGVSLFASAGAFLSGAMNATVFEAAAFGLIFSWIGVLTQCLHRPASRAEPHPAADAAPTRDVPASPGRAHIVGERALERMALRRRMRAGAAPVRTIAPPDRIVRHPRRRALPAHRRPVRRSRAQSRARDIPAQSSSRRRRKASRHSRS